MMKIPKRLEELLSDDRVMRVAVDGAISQFKPWIEDNKLPFFPDYTDHGINHIEQVLATASSLIHDDAWDIFTPQDSGMLVLACLLHDCAMHLSEDGFIALVSDKSSQLIDGMDAIPWPQLWQDFLFSAKRWDDRTLLDVFGDVEPVHAPPLDALKMTKRDRLMVGEFLRRHHPRLAHEIAVFGLPAPKGRIPLLPSLDDDLADLVGLIARSHGMALRTVFPYMDERDYDKHEYRGIHAIFLMTLIRIADYLQIQNERAPKQLLRIKAIRSPLSLREHLAHGAVVGIHNNGNDREAIVIQARPKDVKTFLRLKEWLSGIQNEIDTSWAVLGETYAASELRQLGLVIRRVRSNLDDVKTFASTVSYIPKRVEFDVARAEILKLLVGPLYGNNPAVGIRELMQNAVDAVRELWDFQEQQPEFRDVPILDQEADVIIWIDEPNNEGIAWLTISDRGIGMTEQIITDYFLKVGASFRQSDIWARQHENDDDIALENSSKSRIMRTGRFGIGALAAYLLGDVMEVSTRHLTAKEGLRFVTKLDSEVIELSYDSSLKVGTTIRIPMAEGVFETFAYFDDKIKQLNWNSYKSEWDWYCLRKPEVLRLVGNDRIRLTQNTYVPDVGDKILANNYPISVANYPRIDCNYFTFDSLVCNGIKVINEYFPPINLEQELSTLFVRLPAISIFDPDGKLELNLTRTKLQDDAEIIAPYASSRLQYLLAWLLINTPSRFDLETIFNFGINRIMSTSRFGHVAGPLLPWLCTPLGIAPIEQWNIQNAEIQYALIILEDTVIPNFDDLIYDAVFVITDIDNIWNGDIDTILESCSHMSKRYGNNYLDQVGIRIFTTTQFADSILDYYEGREEIEIETNTVIHEMSLSNNWTSFVFGNPPPTKISATWLDSLLPTDSEEYLPPLIGEWFLADEQPEIEPTGLALEWKNIIRHPVIPYNLKERREKLAHAYEILAPYLENMEQPEDV